MIKPLYTFTELATALGVTEKTIYRMVKRMGIATIGNLIPISELKAKGPLVWESMLLANEDNDGRP